MQDNSLLGFATFWSLCRQHQPIQHGHRNRSQFRCTLHSLFWFGILTIVLCNMQSEPWLTNDIYNLQIQSGIKVFSVRGKGFSPPMGLMEDLRLHCSPLSHWMVIQSNMDHGLQNDIQQFKKRSYKRACRRAIQDGCAWFHGKRIPLHEFPIALIETLKQTTTPHTPACSPVRSHGPVKPRSKPCINVLNWNPGGLGETRFAELKPWLTDTDFNVVVIPETR